ncbi:hypothetical protein [Streptomyces sp. NPDC058542]|uniref:hypothetical protein n=1 Tax=Streptomyces sp. NPDC058542 TaxID=3346543 RepID=UPI00364A243B
MGDHMLRIHFSDVDLARTRLAPAPDPLFEIAASMHRLQSSRGRWAHAGFLPLARRPGSAVSGPGRTRSFRAR